MSDKKNLIFNFTLSVSHGNNAKGIKLFTYQGLVVSAATGKIHNFTIGRRYSEVAVLTSTTRTNPSEPG